jgi:chromosome segregation ATPase
MQGTPRRDPDWEHWPGRPTSEDRVRSRLRTLFVPAEAEDAIAELIAEHSRELERRAEELRGAVAELEQREARTRELHARVEQVLREGSAELDVRHSDLVVRSTELDRREAVVAEAEERVEERARTFGAVELRSAAIERREQALREREQSLEQREQDLRAHEWDLAKREAALGSSKTPSPDAPDDAYVAFTLEHGYRLVERDGAVPAPGDTVELESGPHRCVRVTASPYPGDRRRCAVLERVPPTAAA